jgi:hypothetical protein
MAHRRIVKSGSGQRETNSGRHGSHRTIGSDADVLRVCAKGKAADPKHLVADLEVAYRGPASATRPANSIPRTRRRGRRKPVTSRHTGGLDARTWQSVHIIVVA